MNPEFADHLEIEYVVSPDAAIVVITESKMDGSGIRVMGTAKREPIDKPNSVVGFNLAYSRALKKLAAKAERQANGLISQADHNRAHRQALKERDARRDNDGRKTSTIGRKSGRPIKPRP